MTSHRAETDVKLVRLGVQRIETHRFAGRVMAGELPRRLDFL